MVERRVILKTDPDTLLKPSSVAKKTGCKSQVCNPPPPQPSPIFEEKMKDYILDNDKLKKCMELLLDNINKGLKKDTHPSAIVKCFPSYVQDLPDGTENGKFLALDLGGTNFRVLCIVLDNDKCEMSSKIFAVPQNIMLGTGEELFDHIAACLAEFCTEEGILEEILPLGFTFSFPLTQKGLNVGILEMWTKGFKVSGVVGADVVHLLEEAIQRRGDVKIDVCAVLNDTTGTLMSCAWKNHDTVIGLILGTGTNACYLEKQENSELFDAEDMGSGQVIINTEWGAFGDDGCLDFIRTEEDNTVDKDSINPGIHIHEKMISGMYMGDIVRLLLIKFIKENLMFGGQLSSKLEEQGSFPTKYVSKVESDAPGNFVQAKEVCDKLELAAASDEDFIHLRYICECVSRRAAFLCSAGLVTLLHKINRPKVTIGIDGTLYRLHPTIHDLMVEKMQELCDPNIQFQLMLSEDGSGRGAAIIAAVLARTKEAPAEGEAEAEPEAEG